MKGIIPFFRPSLINNISNLVKINLETLGGEGIYTICARSCPAITGAGEPGVYLGNFFQIAILNVDLNKLNFLFTHRGLNWQILISYLLDLPVVITPLDPERYDVHSSETPLHVAVQEVSLFAGYPKTMATIKTKTFILVFDYLEPNSLTLNTGSSKAQQEISRNRFSLLNQLLKNIFYGMKKY